MANFVDSFGYSNAYLFDTDGTLLFQLKTDLDIGSNLLTVQLKDSELAEVFDRVRTLLQIEVSDYQMYTGRTRASGVHCQSGLQRQGLIIGFVALELGNKHVFRVFKDYSGLGETGETMVVMRNGDELTFVAPPRNEPDAAFKYRVRIGGDKSTAMQKAVQGQRGYGEAIDYRGKPIVAAWSYLPSYRWGMVVKQDVDEAFALGLQAAHGGRALLLAATVLAVTADRALAGADDHAADSRGRDGDRSGRLRRSHGHVQRPRHPARPDCCSRRSAR